MRRVNTAPTRRSTTAGRWHPCPQTRTHTWVQHGRDGCRWARSKRPHSTPDGGAGVRRVGGREGAKACRGQHVPLQWGVCGPTDTPKDTHRHTDTHRHADGGRRAAPPTSPPRLTCRCRQRQTAGPSPLGGNRGSGRRRKQTAASAGRRGSVGGKSLLSAQTHGCMHLPGEVSPPRGLASQTGVVGFLSPIRGFLSLLSLKAEFAPTVDRAGAVVFAGGMRAVWERFWIYFAAHIGCLCVYCGMCPKIWCQWAGTRPTRAVSPVFVAAACGCCSLCRCCLCGCFGVVWAVFPPRIC